jgi:hypothetical protein
LERVLIEMRRGLTEHELRCQNRHYRGTRGLSEENHSSGFRPAFLDTETGAVYASCYADGRPAPCHLLEGLPENLVLARTAHGRISAIKASVVAGFVRCGCFYTREEAARLTIVEAEVV